MANLTVDGSFKPTLLQRVKALAAGQWSAVWGQTIPNFKIYGGATPFRQEDDLGNVYRSFFAQNLVTGYWGLFIFKNGNNIASPRAPVPFAIGRGSINALGWWIGCENASYAEGQIPTWNE